VMAAEVVAVVKAETLNVAKAAVASVLIALKAKRLKVAVKAETQNAAKAAAASVVKAVAVQAVVNAVKAATAANPAPRNRATWTPASVLKPLKAAPTNLHAQAVMVAVAGVAVVSVATRHKLTKPTACKSSFPAVTTQPSKTTPKRQMPPTPITATPKTASACMSAVSAAAATAMAATAKPAATTTRATPTRPSKRLLTLHPRLPLRHPPPAHPCACQRSRRMHCHCLSCTTWRNRQAWNGSTPTLSALRKCKRPSRLSPAPSMCRVSVHLLW